jgi:hypothetical protein
MPNQNLPVAPRFWQLIGPSFILLGLALGSGELIMWPYLTANWGLGLIWGGLLGISLQFILNTEAMRYTMAWGESVFMGFRRMSWLLPMWYVISTFIPWSIPGFSSASADIIVHIFPILPKPVVAVCLLVLGGLILSVGKTLYKTMERFQRTMIMIGLPLIALLVAKFTQPGDWQELSRGLIGQGDGWWFFPPGVALASFVGAFAYSGAGGNLNLAQSYYAKEKGFGMGAFAGKISSLFSGEAKPMKLDGETFADTPANRARWKEWWHVVNLEHAVVFWLLGFVTIIMLAVLSKALVYGLPVQGGLSFLFTQSQVIAQRTQPMLGTFFLIMAGTMLFGTQLGVLESSSRIISENLVLIGYRRGSRKPDR